MGKYCYPAIFKKCEDGYEISFPDLPGCVSCGSDYPDAMLMAEDALALMIANNNTSGIKNNAPSNVNDITLSENEHIQLIACDTSRYERQFNKKVVRKSVSIPKWINDEAKRKGINFSEVLKNALLNIISE